MKIRRILFCAMMLTAVVFSFTSCNSDDDDSGYASRNATRYERAQRYAELTKNGTSGQATLFYNVGDGKVDSLSAPVNWRFTSDSTVVISGVPDSVFTAGMSDASYAKLRDAINVTSPNEFTITAYISYIVVNNTTYSVSNPLSSTINISYDDKSQSFRPMFMYNQYFVGLTDSGKFGIDMCYAGYSLNGTTAMLPTATLISVIAK